MFKVESLGLSGFRAKGLEFGVAGFTRTCWGGVCGPFRNFGGTFTAYYPVALNTFGPRYGVQQSTSRKLYRKAGLGFECFRVTSQSC